MQEFEGVVGGGDDTGTGHPGCVRFHARGVQGHQGVCVFARVYTYTCMYGCISVGCIYIYTFIYIYIYMIYIYTYIIYMYVCMIDVCMYVYVYVYILQMYMIM